MAYNADIEGFERNIKEYEMELERERQVSNEFAYKIIVLSCEIERLSGGEGTVGGIKSREFQELQDSYSRLQTKMVSKNNEIDILITKVGSL